MTKKGSSGVLDTASGVDYSKLDPFKRACLEGCRKTLPYLKNPKVKPIAESLGESASLVRVGSSIIAHVMEGLGTKNLVAAAVDAMKPSSESHYADIAQDTVAMIANDLATCGAAPMTLLMYCAAGGDDWFHSQGRTNALIEGCRRSCEILGCAWMGGESPSLKGLIEPNQIDLAGTMTGIIHHPRKHWIRARNLKPGALMLGLFSSGVHANGLTGIREKVAPVVGYGYDLKAYGGNFTFGDDLLMPTTLYWPVIRDCQKAGIPIQYAVNVTGHGWRKLMRAPQPFWYEINRIPEPQAEFKLIAQVTGKAPAEMYASYNMGIGFVLFISRFDTYEVQRIAQQYGIESLPLGTVEESQDGKRSVRIAPLGINYEEESLNLR